MTKRSSEEKKKDSGAYRVNQSGFNMSVTSSIGKLSLSVSSVYGICEYSSECVTLKMRKGAIRVKGNTLELTVFEDRNVLINGKVSVIELLLSEKKEHKHAY